MTDQTRGGAAVGGVWSAAGCSNDAGGTNGASCVKDAAGLREIVAKVLDPEVPVLTIEDLGVLRAVNLDGSGHVEVVITPTYSGCPAMDTIEADIRTALERHGVTDVTVRRVLSPAWTTDWMSEDGKRKLLDYGIAPPTGTGSGPVMLALSIRCPRCGSLQTEELSHFGSTACKALWVCRSCREPFDHFKAH